MMNYDELPAGPELDRLVAERVMGYSLYHYDKGDRGDDYWALLDRDACAMVYSPRPGQYITEFPSEVAAFVWWQPSTNIAHAWEVVERLRELEQGVEILVNPGHIRVRINYGETVSVLASTVPLGICRCALACILAKKESK